MPLSRSTSALVLAVVLCAPGAALAEEGVSEREARRLDTAGKAHYRAGNYLDAAVAFEAAFEAHALPKYLFNLGKAFEKADELPAAISAYQQYLELVPESGDAEKVAALVSFVRAKLNKTMGSLEIDSTPEDASFRVDPVDGGDAVEGTTPYAGWFEPGDYRLTMRLAGYHDGGRDVNLRVGDEQEILVVLAEKREGADGGEASQPKRAKVRRQTAAPASGTGVAPLGAFMAGGVGLVAGGLFGALAFSKRAEHESYLANAGRPGHTREEAEEIASAADRYALAAVISIGVAVVAAGTGVTLWLIAPGGGVRAQAVWTW